jgi:hypothetical protein
MSTVGTYQHLRLSRTVEQDVTILHLERADPVPPQRRTGRNGRTDQWGVELKTRNDPHQGGR